MRLAVSNLAWDAADDAAVLHLLSDLDVGGLELAPTKVWPRPLDATARDARAYRAAVEACGLRVVAFQAILFGRPELTLFQSEARRAEAVEYLAGLCRLAGWLGSRVLVFGSPKNRLVGSMAPAEALSIARDFFRRVGDRAVKHGTAVCIEANPPEYGGDFVTRTAEAVALVNAVDHPGFGLHLDAGGITLAGDSADEVRACASAARHYHVSEPHLVPIGTGGAGHAGLAGALHAGGYRGWLSIEMKPVPDRPAVDVLRRAIAAARSAYPAAGRQLTIAR
jgi:sugar phosphate isomerase/epimerase